MRLSDIASRDILSSIKYYFGMCLIAILITAGVGGCGAIICCIVVDARQSLKEHREYDADVELKYAVCSSNKFSNIKIKADGECSSKSGSAHFPFYDYTQAEILARQRIRDVWNDIPCTIHIVQCAENLFYKAHATNEVCDVCGMSSITTQ